MVTAVMVYAGILALAPSVSVFCFTFTADICLALAAWPTEPRPWFARHVWHWLPRDPIGPRPWASRLLRWLTIGHWLMVAMLAGLFWLLLRRVRLGAPADALILVGALWLGLVMASHQLRYWIRVHWGPRPAPPVRFP